MHYKVKTRDEHFEADGRPKRILALDGGGLRGILTLGFLAEIEDLLRQRHGADANFRLCDYFDLIAGTSTGAIIATALAMGWASRDLADYYMRLGRRVFDKNSLTLGGFLRAKYDHEKLEDELKTTFGKDTLLGDERIRTGLLVVTKRTDTGSPWPLGNNPRGRYFLASRPGIIANAGYSLWQVVRASTAAPTYFDPERLLIATEAGKPPVEGEFVDGGVSPFNNPALLALMFATLDGYRVGWPLGAKKLLLASLGTGSRDPSMAPAWLAGQNALKAVMGLMDDSATLMETLLQWMSTSPTARIIDRELGDLRNDSLGPAPLLTYLRYNVTLDGVGVAALKPGIPPGTVESLSAMDDPDNMPLLRELGQLAARQRVRAADFPAVFDLPSA
jgi:hypothetical protein